MATIIKVIAFLCLIPLCFGQYSDVGKFKDSSSLSKFKSEINGRIIEVLPGLHFFTFEYRFGLLNNLDLNLQIHKYQYSAYVYSPRYSYLMESRYSIEVPFNLSLSLSYSSTEHSGYIVSANSRRNIKKIEGVGANVTIGKGDYFTIGVAILNKETNSTYTSDDFVAFFPYWYFGMGHYSPNKICPEFGFIINGELMAYIGLGYNFTFQKRNL